MAPSSYKLRPLHLHSAAALHRYGELTEAELETLRPVFKAAIHSQKDLAHSVMQLYAAEMGQTRAQPAIEVLHLLGPEMAQRTRDLVERGNDAFVQGISRLGEKLATCGIPFHEVLTFMLFQWRGYTRIMPQHAQSLEIQDLIAKWSHLRISLLAEAYARVQSARADARIYALEREARRIPINTRTSFHGLVGASPLMRQLYARIEAAARSRSTFLIVGESGTGKELVARAIHERGGPLGARFVALNAAALPRELAESELFGYKRGAFSGAASDYPGLFRSANGGTLFLDEITEMSPGLQGKLLRVLEERAVKPVGGVDEVRIDVRVIASTNVIPEAAVRSGKLRQDLLYRLQKIQFRLPPLRERREDLPLLIDHFIALFNAKLELVPPRAGVERKALDTMRRYQWPGNVRELANAIESAVTLGAGPMIELEDLPASIAGSPSSIQAPTVRSTSRTSLDAAEREAIQHALAAAGGNKTTAAKLLNVSRKMLYTRLTKYSLG